MTHEREITFKGITYDVSYEIDGADVIVHSASYKGTDVTEVLESLNFDFSELGNEVAEFAAMDRYDRSKYND